MSSTNVFSSSRSSCKELAIWHACFPAGLDRRGYRLLGSCAPDRADAIVPLLGNEGAEPLAAENDSFALELFVSPLHGDEAHQQLLSQPGTMARHCQAQPPRGDLAFDGVDDLLVQGVRGGSTDRGAAGEI